MLWFPRVFFPTLLEKSMYNMYTTEDITIIFVYMWNQEFSRQLILLQTKVVLRMCVLQSKVMVACNSHMNCVCILSAWVCARPLWSICSGLYEPVCFQRCTSPFPAWRWQWKRLLFLSLWGMLHALMTPSGRNFCHYTSGMSLNQSSLYECMLLFSRLWFTLSEMCLFKCWK